jgi:uncharacterized coiled-coil protein SlyX
VTDGEVSVRIAELEQRVAALEEYIDALLILKRAERRAADRANGTHLRPVPDTSDT